MAKPVDILIEGAGIIGLSAAEALSRRGFSVAVTDLSLDPVSASWAAAGMLAPLAEWLEHGEGAVEELAGLLAARAVWDAFSARLESETGESIGFDPGPSIFLGSVSGVPDCYRELVSRLPPDAMRARLGTDIAAPHLIHCDGQVDNRLALRALSSLLRARGVHFTDVSPEARFVIAAKGWRSEGVEPVKGEAIALAPHPSHPDRVVRFPGGYIVPKADRTIIGATSVPGQRDFNVAPDAPERLRAKASEVWPGVGEGELIETWAGLRPRPVAGRPFVSRLSETRFSTGGHFRNGILLAPFTAETLAAMICGEPAPEGADLIDTGAAVHTGRSV